MGNIPLPALSIKPPEQQDQLSQFANLMAIKQRQQQMQQQQALAPLVLEQQKQATQEQSINTQKAQQDQKDQMAFRTAMASPELQGKTIGEIADVLAQSGNISKDSWQAAKKADIEHRKSLAEADNKTLENMKAAHDQTQQLYNNVMNMPDDQLQANWPAIAQQYNSIPGNEKMPMDPNKPLPKQALAQFGPMISMGNSYFDQELARREKQADLTKKQGEAQFYKDSGMPAGVPVEAVQQADWLKKNPGKGPSDFLLWKQKNSPQAIVMNNQLGGDKNSAALDFAADNYRKTGQLPAGFSRSPGTTSAIIARAAELDKQAGGMGIATNKSELEANRKSLDSLQKNFDQVSAFENTAKKNLDLVLSKASAVPDLGARFANTPIRMINEKMLGTKEMAEFRAALATAQAETAKVLNSSNASGVLSDTARKELEDIMSGNLSYSALKGQVETFKQDMNNRHESYRMQINDIKGRIGASGSNNSGGNSGSAVKITLPSGKSITIE